MICCYPLISHTLHANFYIVFHDRNRTGEAALRFCRLAGCTTSGLWRTMTRNLCSAWLTSARTTLMSSPIPRCSLSLLPSYRPPCSIVPISLFACARTCHAPFVNCRAALSSVGLVCSHIAVLPHFLTEGIGTAQVHVICAYIYVLYWYFCCFLVFMATG
jgi:hypothetical protein